MKILITGANGYLGQGIVRALLNGCYEITAASQHMDYVEKDVVQRQGDIFEIDDPYTYYGKPDAVVHLAWRNGFVHNHDSHILDLPKHCMFLQKLAASGIKQIVVLGSMHEVGFFEGSIKADTPTNPQSRYGIAKNALRQMVQLLQKERGFVFQWIRGYYIVGNSEHGSSIFSKITEAERRGDKTFPFTSGLNQWDFLDYDDFCEQVAAIVGQQKYTGIINACSGRPEKLADRVERFIQENKYKIRLAYGTFPDRPYDSKAVWGDDAVIREILQERLDRQ